LCLPRDQAPGSDACTFWLHTSLRDHLRFRNLSPFFFDCKLLGAFPCFTFAALSHEYVVLPSFLETSPFREPSILLVGQHLLLRSTKFCLPDDFGGVLPLSLVVGYDPCFIVIAPSRLFLGAGLGRCPGGGGFYGPLKPKTPPYFLFFELGLSRTPPPLLVCPVCFFFRFSSCIYQFFSFVAPTLIFFFPDGLAASFPPFPLFEFLFPLSPSIL